MANLSLIIDDDLLLRARQRAKEQKTSVDALVRAYLEGYVGRPDPVLAMRAFIERAAAAGARSEREWKREDLHPQ